MITINKKQLTQELEWINRFAEGKRSVPMCVEAGTQIHELVRNRERHRRCEARSGCDRRGNQQTHKGREHGLTSV